VGVRLVGYFSCILKAGIYLNIIGITRVHFSAF